MNLPKIIQGRHITSLNVEWIRSLMQIHSDWNRTQLSREICAQWNWSNANGQFKDMACRTLLLKLDRSGLITLPKPLNSGGGNHFKNRKTITHSMDEVTGILRDLTPLRIEVVQAPSLPLLKHLLSEYHYLGFSGTVGENMKYLVYDRNDRMLACLLFGSAAWKTAPRDLFIGWSTQERQAGLSFITNNMRFLILPWVRVPHLASHVLSQIVNRLSSDWNHKYGHPIHVLETFVEKDRFRGTCYKAANWIYVGQTQGRSRNDRFNTLQVPIKDVYLYPLTRHYRKELTHGARRDSKGV
jgi:hypothetical protein